MQQRKQGNRSTTTKLNDPEMHVTTCTNVFTFEFATVTSAAKI